MNKKLLWSLGASCAVLVLISVGLSTFVSNNTPSFDTTFAKEGERGYIRLSIEDVYTDEKVPVRAGDTALEVLEKLNDENPSLSLETEEYEGLGVLVVGMGGKRNGEGDEYWQYEVNGSMPPVGADKLSLTPGDTVEWYFREFDM
jgi:hypothetical protein